MAEDEEAPQEQAEEAPQKRPRKRRVDGPVSLYPLSFEEAVEGLLGVKMDPAKPTTARKKPE